MRHDDHEPGTREDCAECREVAYDPGWYKALRDDRVVGAAASVVAVPDAEQPEVEVVVEERPHEPARRRR
jgi:hypothetical protein